MVWAGEHSSSGEGRRGRSGGLPRPSPTVGPPAARPLCFPARGICLLGVQKSHRCLPRDPEPVPQPASWSSTHTKLTFLSVPLRPSTDHRGQPQGPEPAGSTYPANPKPCPCPTLPVLWSPRSRPGAPAAALGSVGLSCLGICDAELIFRWYGPLCHHAVTFINDLYMTLHLCECPWPGSAPCACSCRLGCAGDGRPGILPGGGLRPSAPPSLPH